MQLLPTILIVY